MKRAWVVFPLFLACFSAFGAANWSQWRFEKNPEPNWLPELPGNWHKVLTLYKDEGWRQSPFHRSGALYVEMWGSKFGKLHVLWDSHTRDGRFLIYQEKRDVSLHELRSGYALETVSNYGNHDIVKVEAADASAEQGGDARLTFLTQGNPYLVPDDTNDQLVLNFAVKNGGMVARWNGAVVNVILSRQAPKGIRRVHLCYSDTPADAAQNCRDAVNYPLTLDEEQAQPQD